MMGLERQRPVFQAAIAYEGSLSVVRVHAGLSDLTLDELILKEVAEGNC